MSMISPRGMYCLRLCLVVLSMLAAPGSGLAEDPLENGHRWSPFEQELREKGIHVDTPSLEYALSHNSDFGVRSSAALILGMRHEVSARKALLQVAQSDPELMVRVEAWVALGRLGDKSALAPLEEIIRDLPGLDRQVRLAAELAELGDPQGYPYAEKAAVSSVSILRDASLSALVEFMSLRKEGGLSSDPFDLLAKLAQDDDAKIRSNALIFVRLSVSKGAELEEAAAVLRRAADTDQNTEIREEARRQLIALEAEAERRSASHGKEKQ